MAEPGEQLGADSCVERDGKAVLALLFTLRGTKPATLSRALKAFEVRGQPGPWRPRGRGPRSLRLGVHPPPLPAPHGRRLTRPLMVLGHWPPAQAP